MKNLHLIPTDKPSIPSRLFYKEKELVFSKKYSVFNGVNIYITNSEEIKEGEYNVPSDFSKISDISKTSKEDLQVVNEKNNGYKKIILTTDPDLIVNSVQPIPDEFLEWFVRNPSCEKVEVVPEQYTQNYHKDIWFNRYKIIIPKEEPKQETLEEAAVEFAKNHSIYPTAQDDTEYGFINGAKWQQEQAKKMYSEEEAGELVYTIIGQYARHYGIMIDGAKLNELFEEFKKK